ncbi:methyltransferase domain-containing protein [Caldimonas sp.]|uniref:tRNA (guanine(46)-N(7))-methyltransferase TrmB n=1 Tax=Caldimonas sp. TaxID=2838790 RepID=UPI00307ECE48
MKPHRSAVAGRTLSRPVRSNQHGPHPRLDELVRRHLSQPFRKPPAPYSVAAFETIARSREGRPLVLDSACGTGESSARLARRHPQALVVGIDQSAERLERGQRKLQCAWPPNLLLLRADVSDVWALMAQAGWRVEHHYLLYPNPWPKAEHVMRRWGTHPRLPALLALGGRVELRSNWAIYAQEFAHALHLAGRQALLDMPGPAELADPVSPFERKYRDAGHTLWRVVCAETQAGKTPVER